MKTILTIALAMFFYSGNAQRMVDLKFQLISPKDSSYIDINTPLKYTLKINNLGPADFNSDDTLRIYLLIDSDTLFFREARTQTTNDHINFTNKPILVGDSIEFWNILYMPEYTENKVVQFCMSIMPFYASNNSIQDTLLDNNSSCVHLRVWKDPNPTFIPHIKTLNANLIYPNPVQNELNLNFSTLNIETITILNSTGSILFNGAATNQKLDSRDWPNGLYYIRIQSNNLSQISKFQIMH